MDTQHYDLRPHYDSRKSFYGKARVEACGGTYTLFSYDTKVAEIREREATVFDTYSDTTTRHIREFLKQQGFPVGSRAFIEQTYMTRKD